jgi:hypothetical protein
MAVFAIGIWLELSPSWTIEELAAAGMASGSCEKEGLSGYWV